MPEIRVLIVDDHAILREGLRALLSYYDDVEVVGEAQDGGDALRLVEAVHPDIVLMDIAMPGMNGLEATRKIHDQFPGTQVLVLTQYEDWQYVMPLLKAGAAGFILKKALGEDLISAIRAIARGESFLYPPVAKVVLEQIQQVGEAAQIQNEELTVREREILSYIVGGLTNRQIAQSLSLSIKTVEWHRGNIMEKLGARSVAELVQYALKQDLEAWLSFKASADE
jgi:DNA-binding NarL/FixJ family response regulator